MDADSPLAAPRTGRHFAMRFIWVVGFAVAFAWVESAVVVYLRKIFFDGHFGFPLVVQWEGGQHIVDPLVRIEFVREIATIFMLLAVGWIAGHFWLQRFCYFLIAFGVWDIFYYVWLKVMVDWPASLLTWDLLFYVPLPWVGPVVAPLLIALTMAGAGTWIIWRQHGGVRVDWRWYDTLIEVFCGLLLIVAFCWDWKNIIQMPGDPRHTGLPNPFAWWLFAPVYAASVGYLIFRLQKTPRADSKDRSSGARPIGKGPRDGE
jgi:hypothetical protein